MSKTRTRLVPEQTLGHEVYLEAVQGENGEEATKVHFRPPQDTEESRSFFIDARYSRSYLFVPFIEEREEDKGLGGGRSAVSRVQEIIDRERITDLIVLSHGWHRNLFSSMAAYDRLTGIFLDMSARARLAPLRSDFRPLLIGAHYHSDPGKDEWVDFSGRRDLGSFLVRVEEAIVPREDADCNLTTDFEQVYELFSRLCAPGVDITHPGFEQRTLRLDEILADYALTNKPDASLNEVLTVSWACYHEAEVAPQTVEQTSDPSRHVTLMEYVSTLFNLVLALSGGALAVYSLFDKNVKAFFLELYSQETAGKVLTEGAHPAVWPSLVTLGLITLLWGLLWLVVGWDALQNKLATRSLPKNPLEKVNRRRLQNKGLRFIGLIFYLPLQVAHIAPILAWCIVTPLVSSVIGAVLVFAVILVLTVLATQSARAEGLILYWGLFWLLVVASIHLFSNTGYLSERPKFDDDADGSEPRKSSFIVAWPGAFRAFLADLALMPIRTAKRLTRPEQGWMDVWKTVENLLAFWTMAERAVRVGGVVGKFIEDVTKQRSESGEGKRLRVHLIGHSHGGLVVTNAASFLCRRPKSEMPMELQSVTTINGAYRSDWFEGQDHVMSAVSGCVSSLYSRYDTANKLWYPLANVGRKSSGSVGLWLGKNQKSIADPLPSISVTEARLGENEEPDLVGRIRAVGQEPNKAKALNIDVSRVVFKGPFLPQGAHGEIYSKDVIATLWRVLQFSEWRRGL